MNISIDGRWEEFVEKSVAEGHYGSAKEVVQEGLRLIEERENGIAAVRAKLEQSIAAGGDISQEEMDAALDATTAALKRKAY